MAPKVTALDSTEQFRREVRDAPPDVQGELKLVLQLLLANSAAGRLRVHPLSGYAKPTIFKADVFTNRAWQITFEMNGTTAVLRRLATHKQLDRRPR